MQYKCIKKVNCHTNNLIYCLQCNLCNKQYVGQTKNRIKDRFNGHINDIEHNRDKPVSQHMNETHQVSKDPPISIYILELIHADNQSERSQALRDKWETIWVSRLNTRIPYGLNIED